MVKIKYDVTDVDGKRTADEEALDFEEAPKGLYVAKLHQLEPSHAKGDDGQPDKNRPMLVAHWELVADKDGEPLDKKYWRIRDYYSQSKAAEWKMDQFLQAVGVAKPTTKRKGTLDTDKVEGTLCLVRVREGSLPDGSYRAEIGRVSAYAGPDPDDAASDITDEELEEELEEDLELEDDEELEEDFAEDEWPDADEVDAMSGADLKELIKEMGEADVTVKIPKGSKVGKVKEIVKEALAEHMWAEADDDEEEDEDEDEIPF